MIFGGRSRTLHSTAVNARGGQSGIAGRENGHLRCNFALTPKGVYYSTPRNPDNTSSILYLDFASGQTTEIQKLEKREDLGLAVSPDGKELLYAQIDLRGVNLMLLENFQ